LKFLLQTFRIINFQALVFIFLGFEPAPSPLLFFLLAVETLKASVKTELSFASFTKTSFARGQERRMREARLRAWR
jgi:hypothetical protein